VAGKDREGRPDKGQKGVEGSYCLLPILGSATEPPARAGKKPIL